MGRKFKSDLLFAFSIGSIPLLYFIIERITEISFLYKGVFSCFIIFVSGILFWQYRIFHFQMKYKELSYGLSGDIPLVLEIDSFNDFKFWLYLFLGFVTGAIICVVTFRKNKNIDLKI